MLFVIGNSTMEVADIFHRKGFDVISVFGEPDPHNFKIYVKKPTRPVYAENIIKFIQRIGYEVLAFDNRCPDTMCILFKDDSNERPNETLFYYTDYKLYSSCFLINVPIVFGRCKEKKIKTDGKESVEIKKEFLTDVPFQPCI